MGILGRRAGNPSQSVESAVVLVCRQTAVAEPDYKYSAIFRHQVLRLEIRQACYFINYGYYFLVSGSCGEGGRKSRRRPANELGVSAPALCVYLAGSHPTPERPAIGNPPSQRRGRTILGEP